MERKGAKNPMSIERFLFLFIIEFLTGSIMFSYLIAKLLKIDLRGFRDGNPGGANLLRKTNVKVGLLGIFLDFLKGYFPLFLVINKFQFSQVELTILTLAPLLGHMFSPFLKFKGGKGIATTFGIWSALTKYEVPMLLGLIYTIFIFIKAKDTSPEFDMIRALTGMIFVMVYVRIFYPQFFAISLLNFILLCFSHRKEIYNLVKNRQI